MGKLKKTANEWNSLRFVAHNLKTRQSRSQSIKNSGDQKQKQKQTQKQQQQKIPELPLIPENSAIDDSDAIYQFETNTDPILLNPHVIHPITKQAYAIAIGF
jgi:hypothetical protein